jgi:hypothetical protein
MTSVPNPRFPCCPGSCPHGPKTVFTISYGGEEIDVDLCKLGTACAEAAGRIAARDGRPAIVGFCICDPAENLLVHELSIELLCADKTSIRRPVLHILRHMPLRLFEPCIVRGRERLGDGMGLEEILAAAKQCA